MTLPVINAPTYELTIPSTKKRVKFRPFLVKEEKALLIAQQSEEDSVMTDTLKSVINSCLFGKVNVDTLAFFDLEYMFCQIRSKSVGEFSEMKYKCLNCNHEKGVVLLPIDLSKIEVEMNSAHTSEIEVTEDITIKMKYPNLETIKKMKNTEVEEYELVFDIVVDCVDSIYTSDEVFLAQEVDRSEIVQFIDNLTKAQFDKIENFFVTMPKLNKTIKWSCPHCKYNHVTEIEGLSNFF